MVVAVKVYIFVYILIIFPRNSGHTHRSVLLLVWTHTCSNLQQRQPATARSTAFGVTADLPSPARSLQAIPAKLQVAGQHRNTGKIVHKDTK